MNRLICENKNDSEKIEEIKSHQSEVFIDKVTVAIPIAKFVNDSIVSASILFVNSVIEIPKT